MKKRFLSLVCIVSLLVNINIGNFKTYATDKTTFSINEDNVFLKMYIVLELEDVSRDDL
ncbi:hypothetical protein [uncultured Parvimonas sp.]|uniref:hypothetical protein n=1 Tax=uncultured Parvimonas sp. TaxID=747372 RepID=UPI0025949E8F|nr:hypothetical protein [uncultured Parvimonas sp.]